MSYDKRMSVCIGGLEIKSPLIVASGVWPMDRECWPAEAMEKAGGLCTKGLTLQQKTGNTGNRIWEAPCGILNSIGLENPGIEAFLKDQYPDLAKMDIPVIFNLSFDNKEDLLLLFEYLHETAGDVPVELNVSCPNVSRGGLSWAQNSASLETIISLARKKWEGPLWVKLSPNVASVVKTALVAENAGADAVVVANTWLGTIIDIENLQPVFHNIHAGLSGPAVFPLALRLVWEVSSSVDIPVIASGGIASWQDAAAMIAAGASAVQIGSALFSELEIIDKIQKGLTDFLERKNIKSIVDLVGAAKE